MAAYLLLTLCLSPAFAEDTLSSAFAARVAATPKRGYLYQVTPSTSLLERAPGAGTACLYLYGTVHVGRAGLFPVNVELANRLQAADRLALEADPDKEAVLAHVLQQLAFFPPEDSLANHLPAELLGRLPALGQRYHLPMERMLRMRAWLLAQTFEVLELQRAGLSGGDGVEVILANFARQRQIPVLEIEGFTAQIELLRKEPEDVQRDELQESIDEIEDGEAAAQAEMLLSGWATGDEAAVEAEIAELRAQDSPFSRYMLTEILEARDTTMTDRAEAFLEEGGVTFFAVGALHLFSDAGLIAQLRRRGYRVENLQSSAGPSAGGAAP